MTLWSLLLPADRKHRQGNPYVHIILRGGSSGPNYEAEFVRDAGAKLKKAGVTQKMMV